ncbi:MAG: hypothetical protein KIT84_42555 [Labilithrix sp.]|nr:hypothetical protein [Labilithrix sp.]MCW5817759.1 hypothetical protein [Labilithrix sp.]
MPRIELVASLVALVWGGVVLAAMGASALVMPYERWTAELGSFRSLAACGTVLGLLATAFFALERRKVEKRLSR